MSQVVNGYCGTTRQDSSAPTSVFKETDPWAHDHHRATAGAMGARVGPYPGDQKRHLRKDDACAESQSLEAGEEQNSKQTKQTPVLK